MSLADRLNSALMRNRLQPVAAAPVPEPEPGALSELVGEEQVSLDPGPYDAAEVVVSEVVYKTLKEGLKSAHKHSPDEFGTTVIVVEKIGDKIQLPMKAGKYIVDDIQKKSDGHYEVHLVSGQR
jgi:hypothetical protein